MTATECLERAKAAGDAYQRFINAFVDEFRRASPGGARRARRRPYPLVRRPRGAGRRRGQRALPGDRNAHARLGRPRRKPRALLRVPRAVVRDARASDGGVTCAVQDPERVRARELFVAGVSELLREVPEHVAHALLWLRTEPANSDLLREVTPSRRSADRLAGRLAARLAARLAGHPRTARRRRS